LSYRFLDLEYHSLSIAQFPLPQAITSFYNTRSVSNSNRHCEQAWQFPEIASVSSFVCARDASQEHTVTNKQPPTQKMPPLVSVYFYQNLPTQLSNPLSPILSRLAT